MVSNNTLYFIGAAVVDVAIIAGTFIVKHYRQKQATARYLERVEQQLADLQKEIRQLWLLQDEKRVAKLKNGPYLTNRADEDDDSSDLEFYEFSDDEDATNQPHHLTVCLKILDELDQKLNTQSTRAIEEALDTLTSFRQHFPNDVELLWRIGEAHQKLCLTSAGKEAKLDHMGKGLAACELALELNPKSADAHKWCGMLLGARSELQPLTEKIKDAALFKKHIDLAFALNPDDGFLHYVLGRFVYETANMTWIERKAAKLIFEDLSIGTFEEALERCLKAERLLKGKLKDNKLALAKCQIALGKYKDAVDWLTKADKCGYDSLDSKVNTEINALLKKYSSYG